MQQIIAYRNPLEAALWNATASAEVFVIGAGVVCFFVSFLFFNYFIERKVKFYKRGTYGYAALAISVSISLFVVYKMWV